MDSELLFFIILVLIALVGISTYLRAKDDENEKDLEIEKRSAEDICVKEAFHEYAYNVIQGEYILKGKQIDTAKGYFRASFTNDVNRKIAQCWQECIIGDKFSEEFCLFVKVNYPEAKIKDLKDIIFCFFNTKERNREEGLLKFLNNLVFITPNEFFQIRQAQKGDVVGVYIIYNVTKNKYYVGQAKKLFFRINQHFTGHGNGDVYADYKYGDAFAIKIVKLADSGYDDIDLLERDLIDKYRAYDYGYNKTAGNRL